MRVVNRRAPSATAIWVVLMAATIVSTWVLAKDDFGREAGAIGVLLLAGVKARLVILHFMEIRCAPWKLRAILEVWVVAATTTIVGFYLAAGQV